MRSDDLIRTAARGERVSSTVRGQVSDCSGKQARFCAVSIQSSFSSLPLGGGGAVALDADIALCNDRISEDGNKRERERERKRNCFACVSLRHEAQSYSIADQFKQR